MASTGERCRSDRAVSGSAVGLEEKTDTADEHGRGGRVWNRFEKIWLGALLNTFEKIGLIGQVRGVRACNTEQVRGVPARAWRNEEAT